MDRRAFGAKCEEIAARHLRRKGYRVVARNVDLRIGEIDIVARQGKTLVFVEVKAKTSLEHGAPREMVTAAKQRKLSQLARLYMSQNRISSVPVRFDVVEVVVDESGKADVTLIPAAFDAR
jgi:putative endonuclease